MGFIESIVESRSEAATANQSNLSSPSLAANGASPSVMVQAVLSSMNLVSASGDDADRVSDDFWPWTPSGGAKSAGKPPQGSQGKSPGVDDGNRIDFEDQTPPMMWNAPRAEGDSISDISMLDSPTGQLVYPETVDRIFAEMTANDRRGLYGVVLEDSFLAADLPHAAASEGRWTAAALAASMLGAVVSGVRDEESGRTAKPVLAFPHERATQR